MGKGKSYLTEEDIALCRAWIRASEDAITGCEQKADFFWRSVFGLFCGYGPEEARRSEGTWKDRNINALRHRWALISREVGKFGSVYHRVVAAHPSGKNEEDLVRDALLVYGDLQKKDGSPKKEIFQFLDCWKLLRLSPKWSGQGVGGERIGNSKRMRDECTHPSDEESPEVEKMSVLSSGPRSSTRDYSDAVRPTGRKRAKREAVALEAQKRMESHIASIAQNMDGQYRELRTYNRLMALSMPGGNARSRRALEVVRKRICEEIEEEEEVPEEEQELKMDENS